MRWPDPAIAQRAGIWLAWAGIVAAAIWLRLWQLDIQILIDDEWHAVHRLLQAGYGEIFLSFGHADYSVPLTLLFRFLADHFTLTEWHMRALPLLGGLSAVIVVPYLLRAWLDGRERLFLGALLAISPLLIHFSRYVRPYALVVVLGFIAMVLLWQWWQSGGRARAWGFAVCAVLSAWLHPLTTLFTGAALAWFGVAGLYGGWRTGQWGDLKRVLLLGGLTTAACCALLLPPMIADPWSIAVKSGKHQLEWATVIRSWELIVGLGGGWLVPVTGGLAVLGAARLWQRDVRFLLYWAWMLAVAVVAIMLLGPEWIHNALVLVRYTAIAAPLWLALVALGLFAVLDWATRPAARDVRWLTGAAVAVGLLASLAWSGPLTEVYRGINQFTNGLRYQLDYDFERSPYHALMSPIELPDYYRRIVSESGEWEVVVGGWAFESYKSPLSEYQRLHQLPMRIGMLSGLCADRVWGEWPERDDLRIELRQFVRLSDLLESPGERNRFVVFHREMPEPLEAFDRHLPDLFPCIRAFRERFGEPWFESASAVVFRLPAHDVSEP